MPKGRFDVLASLRQPVIVTDRALRVVFWNEAAAARVGIPANRALGRPLHLHLALPAGGLVLDDRTGEGRLAGGGGGEVRRLPASGEPIPPAWVASEVDLDDGRTGFLLVGRDFTGEGRTEEVARSPEENYREIFHNVSDAIWVHDPATFRFIEVNRSVERMFGYTVAEALELTVADISSGIPPYVQASAQVLMAKAVAGEPQLFEWQCRHKDGHLFWTEVNLTCGEVGGRRCVLAIERDITERKRAQATREFRAQVLGGLSGAPSLEPLVEVCLDLALSVSGADGGGIWLLDRESGAFVPARQAGGSGSAAEDLGPIVPGTPTHELVVEGRPIYGRRADGTVGPDSGSRESPSTAVIPVRLSGQAIACFRLAFGRADLPAESAREHLELLAAEAGHHIGRALAERRLRASEETFRALSEHSPDVIMRFDRRHRHLYVNPAIASRTGLPAGEVIGRTHEELGFPMEVATLWREAIDRVFATARPNRIEFVHPPGQWSEALLSPEFAPGGQVTAVIASARDVTDRKRAERERARLEGQLQQAMKMEAIGRLAGGVAHDFNNLLTGIQGHVSLALMDLQPRDPLADALREIARAADSAAALTSQLLAFSRKQLIEPRVIDLNELIAQSHRMLTRLIGEDVRLETVPGARLDAVRVDPGQIEQVLVNLAVNARDAMPDGGRLTIETANVDLDDDYVRSHPQSHPGRYVLLAVSDTGQGMSEHVKAHLFEPFFTTKAKGQGTGLGLATTYGTVQQAGGFVEVYSEPGHGTTVKVYLPRVADKPEGLGRSRPTTEMPTGDETVLLVEDEAIVRDLAARILRRLGYRVLAAASGGDALVVAEQHAPPIHLLFTDVVMPGMNGRTLARRILELHPEVKVLYSSGYTENAIAHHGMVDPGLDFIAKPYTPQALARKLRQVLGR